jgi:hypothetical protein
MHLPFGRKWDEIHIGLCREIVAEADKDGTGQLTIQEFTNSPKVYINFKNYDKDLTYCCGNTLTHKKVW